MSDESHTISVWSSAHGIVESLMLEKTSKIIKSNCQPVTTMPSKPCPEVPYLHVFWTSPGMVTPPLPWAACYGSGDLSIPFFHMDTDSVSVTSDASCCRGGQFPPTKDEPKQYSEGPNIILLPHFPTLRAVISSGASFSLKKGFCICAALLCAPGWGHLGGDPSFLWSPGVHWEPASHQHHWQPKPLK